MKLATKNSHVDYSAISRQIGVCHSNLWFYFNGERKWALETWLDTLATMKAIELNDDEEMVIKVKLPKRIANRFRKLEKSLDPIEENSDE